MKTKRDFLLLVFSVLLLPSLGWAFEFEKLTPEHVVRVQLLDQSGLGDGWDKRLCGRFHFFFEELSKTPVQVLCGFINPAEFRISSTSVGSLDYGFSVIRHQDGQSEVLLKNYQNEESVEFDELAWTLRDVDSPEGMALLRKIISNLSAYMNNEKAIKDLLLLYSLESSRNLQLDSEKLKIKDKNLAIELTLDEARGEFIAEEKQRKTNVLRTLSELALLHANALVIYLANDDFNAPDFKHKSLEGVKKRLTGEAWEFDANPDHANSGHALAGVLYYQVARSNGYTSLESFLIGLASSTVWEFLEYREDGSINDQIITPGGGYVVGEATVQIFCELMKKGTSGAKLAAAMLNAPATLNRYMDGKSYGKDGLARECAKPRWSDLHAYIGTESVKRAGDSSSRSQLLVGFMGETQKIDPFATEDSQGLILETAFSRFLAEMSFTSDKVDFQTIAQIVSVAYYKQRSLGPDEFGRPQNVAFSIGVGHAATYTDRSQGTKDDFYGTIGIAGPAVHFELNHAKGRIRVDFGIYGDFVMVKSYAIDRYAADNTTDDLVTPLRRADYYWGTGHSMILGVKFDSGRFHAGINAQRSEAEIIFTRDRYPEQSTNRTIFQDEQQIGRVWVAYDLTKKWQLKLVYEKVKRAGEAATYFEEGSDTRKMLTLEHKF